MFVKHKVKDNVITMDYICDIPRKAPSEIGIMINNIVSPASVLQRRRGRGTLLSEAI